GAIPARDHQSGGLVIAVRKLIAEEGLIGEILLTELHAVFRRLFKRESSRLKEAGRDDASSAAIERGSGRCIQNPPQLHRTGPHRERRSDQAIDENLSRSRPCCAPRL